MNINFKQPKYVLPLIFLPFLCLFFYVWKSSVAKPKNVIKEQAGLSSSVGPVSTDIRKRQLKDKLDAYRNTYKEANGETAVGVIPSEASANPAFSDQAATARRLDSLRRLMKTGTAGNPSPQVSARVDPTLQALTELNKRRQVPEHLAAAPPEKDPMEIFRQQMAIMDSINKQNDPAFKEEQRKKALLAKAGQLKESQLKLKVQRADSLSGDFNTVMPQRPPAMISAIIDENVTGYAGSRLRLKLLEDIRAGSFTVSKGTYVYAQISGFSGQRVSLSVTSILYEGRILPVRLDIYDLDGLPGLYVPSSAFRDFSKDLGGNSIQGVTLDGSSGNSQFIMSSLDKMFQSTSSAIAELIRKNKAKLKYNSYLYLIDPDELQKTQKTF